jgi:hypothetical protein
MCDSYLKAASFEDIERVSEQIKKSEQDRKKRLKLPDKDYKSKYEEIGKMVKTQTKCVCGKLQEANTFNSLQKSHGDFFCIQ